MNQQTLRLRAASLSVLRNIGDLPLYRHYTGVFSSLNGDISRFAEAYGALCDMVYRTGDVGRALADAVHFDMNALTALVPSPAPAFLLDAATRDLETLQAVAALDGEALLSYAREAFPGCGAFLDGLPRFPAGSPLPVSDGAALYAYYHAEGYGPFAQGTAFSVGADACISPIFHADPIRLTDLKGYERQKKSIIDNTLSFLEGKNANNILLYGDKGTGKSSTVKAVANEFAPLGLKIIELPLSRITAFPSLCTQVSQSPFHFIVFLDDLSFNQEDENFTALKAFIEGGITGKPENLLIYATSNRRHLVNERFSDRQGDDIHIRDTLETITSLSDRFGLEITFSVPDKDDYLVIVDQLADEQQLDIPRGELHLLAERFALRKNGRSPRTARQFISYQVTQLREADS
ncbi:ATP-binding protein [Intestinibacillus massiliensis]|uniref:ATP-binding protein n=1 Tax=Intestinibacillus massiliensis TaxID=1871029 RepID=UPI000B360E35|nr:ATP-binding protein [Intestinibacillus massiliensis]